MYPHSNRTPDQPVKLTDFDFDGISVPSEADRSATDTEEDLLFRRMFSSELTHSMPRPKRPSPAARFSMNNTPFRG